MILLAQLTATEGSSALARLVEPWNSLYSDSKVVSSAVVFLHLVDGLVRSIHLVNNPEKLSGIPPMGGG